MKRNCDTCYHANREWSPGKDCEKKKRMDLIKRGDKVIGCRNWKSYKSLDRPKESSKEFSPGG